MDRHILNPDNPIINLRISGDGRNVGCKVKHVIITYTILDNFTNLHKVDYHYTILLYLDNESYELLQKIIVPMASELNDLVLNRLENLDGRLWTIKSYFSS